MRNATLAPTASIAKLSASSPNTLAVVRGIEALVRTVEQAEVVTEHVFHGGMYARTVRIPAGLVLVGTLIKIPTLLIVHGDADVLTGDEWAQIRGYGVLPGSAGRKALMVTRSPVEMTMVFPSQAQTVDDAEREFTDEYENLVSRLSESDIVLRTGE